MSISTADVVVIGGGIFGCCAAYHLAKAGVGRVVLIERSAELAAQTSSAAAGFINLWNAGWNAAEVELERYAVAFYRALSLQHDIGFKAVGLLTLAVTSRGAQDLADSYHRALSHLMPDEIALLSPHEVKQLFPLIDDTQIHAALWWPGAIRLQAPLAVQALGYDLREAGVVIQTSTTVTGIDVAEGRVSAVQTSSGLIHTPCVVNAAGAWAGPIARMVGVSLPLFPLQVGRLVTRPLHDIPHDLPMLLVHDYHGLYLREEDGGLLIGTDNTLMHGPGLARDIAQGFGLDSGDIQTDVAKLPIDLHRFHEWLAQSFSHVMPVLHQFDVASLRSGLPVRTLDQRHVLGQTNAVEGFYIIGGDNEVGMTHGPGLGRLLAELITTGTTSADSTGYHPDRWTVPHAGLNPIGLPPV